MSWKSIQGFSKYQVSSAGQIKNARTGGILSPSRCGKYIRNTLCNDEGITKRVFVHVLVALHFIPKVAGKPFVNHIDGNGFNNHVNNLEWCTASENKKASHVLRGTKAVLQLDLDGKLVKRWHDTKAVVEANPTYRICGISKASTGREPTYKGFKWKYEHEPIAKAIRDLYSDEVFIQINTMESRDFSNYYVSNYGLVRNARNMILKPCDDTRGYDVVALYNKIDGISYQMRVNRLVAYAFHPDKYSPGLVVNHMDGARKNNHSTNLEWCTSIANSRHGCGVSVDMLDKNTNEVLKTFTSQTEACEYLELSAKKSGSISTCCKGKRQSAFGYRWRYSPQVDDGGTKTAFTAA